MLLRFYNKHVKIKLSDVLLIRYWTGQDRIWFTGSRNQNDYFVDVTVLILVINSN
jgi:hypothetical protein